MLSVDCTKGAKDWEEVDTVMLGAKLARKLQWVVSKLELQMLASHWVVKLGKGLQEAGKSIGRSIERAGDKLQQGK